MFRPGIRAGYGVRLRSGLVTHNNSAAEVCSVQIKGMEETPHRQHRPLSLERASQLMDMSITVKDPPQSVMSGAPRKQCASMLASMASLCPSSGLKAAKSSISVTRSASLEREPGLSSAAKSGGSARQTLTISEGDSSVKLVCGAEELLLVRSSSGVSMVTSEADFKEKEEEKLAMNTEHDNLEESGDDNGWSESEASATEEDSETSNHPMAKEHESVATTWTDDKHSSYLNSIEATFVRNLYKQGFHAMDVNGKSGPADDCEHDCVESRPRGLHGCCTSDPSEFFELLQGGHEKAYYHPQNLDPSLSVPPAVLHNPWIQHFKQKVTNVTSTGVPVGSTMPEVTLNTKELLMSLTPEDTNASKGQKPVEEMEKDRVAEADEACAEDEGLEYKGMDNAAEDSDMRQGLRVWQSRLQSQGQVSANAVCRKDNSIWLAKRPSDYEHGNANAFHAKRHKSTQQDLAWKDLEMLNEYVAGEQAQNEFAAALVTTKSELPDQAIIDHQLKPLKSLSQPTLDICSSELEPLNSEENKPLGQVYSLLEHMEFKGVKVKSVASDGSGLMCPNTLSSCTTSQMIPPSLSETLPSAMEGQYGKLELKTELNGVNYKTLLLGESNDYVQLLDEKVDGSAHRISIFTKQSLTGKHDQGSVGEDGQDVNLQTQQWLEGAEATECNPQVSPLPPLRGRTWTWGTHGLRRPLHEPLQPLNSKR